MEEDEYQILRNEPEAQVPSRGYPDDAGLDLTVIGDSVVYSGQPSVLATRISGALPANTWGLIVGRSSTWVRRGLMVIPAVIDAGWRGELFISVFNPSPTSVTIRSGDRVGQIILLPVWQGNVREVASLPGHARGTNGWGSTGGVKSAGDPFNLLRTAD